MPPAALAVPAPPPASVPALDHLSWSSITTYCSCPRKFYFRYVARLPEEFVLGSLALGTSVHQAVEAIHESQLRGEAIPDVESLLRRYDSAWTTATSRAREVMYAKDENAAVLRTTALRILSAYREYIIAGQERVKIIGIEHEERFRLLAGVPDIVMRVDLMELTPEGDLVITDIKTSRSRWNESKIRESLFQLLLYGIGLLPWSRALGAKRIVPQFIVVTKAKSPLIQRLQPQSTPADVYRLKQQVLEVWHGIEKGVFVQHPGWQCSQCPYKRRCLG